MVCLVVTAYPGSMTTNWGSNTQESVPQWQQPDFADPTPTLSGEVLLPGERFSPAPSAATTEAHRLRRLRSLLIPLVVVIGLIAGLWWQTILVAILVNVVVRRRLWQLKAEQIAAQARQAHPRTNPTDLR
jgi:hypothetical protein